MLSLWSSTRCKHSTKTLRHRLLPCNPAAHHLCPCLPKLRLQIRDMPATSASKLSPNMNLQTINMTRPSKWHRHTHNNVPSYDYLKAKYFTCTLHMTVIMSTNIKMPIKTFLFVHIALISYVKDNHNSFMQNIFCEISTGR